MVGLAPATLEFAKRKHEALEKSVKSRIKPPKRKHKNEILAEKRASNKEVLFSFLDPCGRSLYPLYWASCDTDASICVGTPKGGGTSGCAGEGNQDEAGD